MEKANSLICACCCGLMSAQAALPEEGSGAGSGSGVTWCFKGMWEGGITIAMAEVSVSLSVILQQQRRVRVELWSCSCFIMKTVCLIIFRYTGR